MKGETKDITVDEAVQAYIKAKREAYAADAAHNQAVAEKSRALDRVVRAQADINDARSIMMAAVNRAADASHPSG